MKYKRPLVRLLKHKDSMERSKADRDNKHCTREKIQ